MSTEIWHKSRQRTYRAWQSMKDRCNNMSHKKAHNYALKGITYPEAWEIYENFLADMGECPATFSLDRKDGERGYSKENCRWADLRVQNFNRKIPKTNTSGVKGVCFIKSSQTWMATGRTDCGRNKNLYSGSDFFKAVCARKSWELQYTHRIGA